MNRLKWLPRVIRNLYLVMRYYPHLKISGPFWRIRFGRGFELTQFPKFTSTLVLEIGEGSVFQKEVWVKGSAFVKIGKNTLIGRRNVLGCNHGISVGNNVLMAENVSIRDTDHKFDDPDIPINRQGIACEPVTIEDDVWIGYGAVITKGVTIGNGAVIAANCVVTKDVPPFAVCAGIPGKVIKYRKPFG